MIVMLIDCCLNVITYCVQLINGDFISASLVA